MSQDPSNTEIPDAEFLSSWKIYNGSFIVTSFRKLPDKITLTVSATMTPKNKGASVKYNVAANAQVVGDRRVLVSYEGEFYEPEFSEAKSAIEAKLEAACNSAVAEVRAANACISNVADEPQASDPQASSAAPT